MSTADAPAIAAVPLYDVITFGETMLRLSPPRHGRLEAAETLDAHIGGSESNTAVALVRLGLRVAWGSRLPANGIGRRIESEIRRWGVGTSLVVWDEEPNARAGVYFLEFGTAPRGTEVLYDRAGSSASKMRSADVPDALIARARLLHLSGITPALSASCAEAVAHALSLARQQNVKTAFDVNFRARLWSPHEARAGLEPLLPNVGLLLCSLSDAATVFGVEARPNTPQDVPDGARDNMEGLAAARALRERYGVSAVVVTCGEQGVAACDAAGEYTLPALTAPAYSDPQHRVGSGDAFNAGALWGLLQENLPLGLEYGVAMAALKRTLPGDLLLATRQEIEAARQGEQASLRR